MTNIRRSLAMPRIPLRRRLMCGFSLVTAIFLLVVLSALGAFMVKFTGLQQNTGEGRGGVAGAGSRECNCTGPHELCCMPVRHDQRHGWITGDGYRGCFLQSDSARCHRGQPHHPRLSDHRDGLQPGELSCAIAGTRLCREKRDRHARQVQGSDGCGATL